MTHKERLLSAGLLNPLTDDQLYRRNGILWRIKEGETIQDAPVFCVFRRDEPFRHVMLSGKKECQWAELIQDKLYSYEAWRLCNHLNAADPVQPPGPAPFLPPPGMYGLCNMETWADWENRHAQLKLEV